jgi:hypothetical protein
VWLKWGLGIASIVYQQPNRSDAAAVIRLAVLFVVSLARVLFPSRLELLAENLALRQQLDAPEKRSLDTLPFSITFWSWILSLRRIEFTALAKGQAHILDSSAQPGAEYNPRTGFHVPSSGPVRVPQPRWPVDPERASYFHRISGQSATDASPRAPAD